MCERSVAISSIKGETASHTALAGAAQGKEARSDMIDEPPLSRGLVYFLAIILSPLQDHHYQ